HNFLRFYGTSKLPLSGHKSTASSLTLILAPNDSGKTSLIRGLEFLFYGTVDSKAGDHAIAALVNDETVRTAHGSEVTGYVQAIFASRGGDFSIRRSVTAKSSRSSDRRLISVELASLEGEGKQKKWREDRAGVLEYKLERLMPKSLFHYFFFQ